MKVIDFFFKLISSHSFQSAWLLLNCAQPHWSLQVIIGSDTPSWTPHCHAWRKSFDLTLFPKAMRYFRGWPAGLGNASELLSLHFWILLAFLICYPLLLKINSGPSERVVTQIHDTRCVPFCSDSWAQLEQCNGTRHVCDCLQNI